MTTSFLARRRGATPRRRIVHVYDRWSCGRDEPTRRLVLVEQPSGELQRGWMPDEHPEVVAFLAAVAVAA